MRRKEEPEAPSNAPGLHKNQDHRHNTPEEPFNQADSIGETLAAMGFPQSPITDEELYGAKVLATSVIELQIAVGDLRELVTRAKLELRHSARTLVGLTAHLQEVLKDLLENNTSLESSNRTLRRLERQSTHNQLPLWFWRPEGGLDLKQQILRRARYLIHEAKTGVDDTWDLLREFCDEWAQPAKPVKDDQLAEIIEYATREGGAHACSS